LISQAEIQEEKQDLIAAKSTYQKLITDFPNESEVQIWQKRLEEINLKIIFSNIITPQSQIYEVKPSDNLVKIAKQFNTTVDLIKKINNLDSDLVLPGRKLKIWTAKFSLLIDRSQNILILKSDDEVIKTYRVSTGENFSTPLGKFKIINKLISPVWYKTGAIIPPDSPENILGSRWLGFNLPGYGIHGTTDPSTIGKHITKGCVRMLNKDIEELYIFLPIGTEVTIIE
jgi:lipoprotein-anchoring transpeptidase ErfK/SrfK